MLARESRSSPSRRRHLLRDSRPAGGPARRRQRAPSLQWHKNLALLVYLARSPKRARARDHLIGLLWGDEAEKDARHSLNQAVSTLRTYAGESIETDRTHVRLADGAVSLDVEQLDACGAAGDYEAAARLIAGV